MLPNFLVVGAQKAATTSLHNYLSAHVDIYLPSEKETKFFACDDLYAKGISFYEQQFFGARGRERSVGEVDPDYLFHDYVAGRIAEHLDSDALRLVFIFRNPVERAFSHYLMTLRRGYEILSFEEAIDKEPERMRGDYESRSRFSYVSRGYYLDQVERYLEHFPQENMLFLLTEDLKKDPAGVLRRIFEFIGVSGDLAPSCPGKAFHESKVPRSRSLMSRIQKNTLEKKIARILIPSRGLRRLLRRNLMRVNQTGHHDERISKEAQLRLRSCFAEPNRRLSEFLGRSLDSWNEVPDR